MRPDLKIHRDEGHRGPRLHRPRRRSGIPFEQVGEAIHRSFRTSQPPEPHFRLYAVAPDHGEEDIAGPRRLVGVEIGCGPYTREQTARDHGEFIAQDADFIRGLREKFPGLMFVVCNDQRGHEVGRWPLAGVTPGRVDVVRAEKKERAPWWQFLFGWLRWK